MRRGPAVCLPALLACGVLGGLLAAATLLPVVGSVGITTNSVARTLTDLPPSPHENPLQQRTVLLDRNGKQFAQFYTENRTIVPLRKVAPVMRQAIVAIEDSRFYEHAGLDIKGTLRALVTNAQAGGVRQGGSSLTQQLVKNILVENAQTSAERAQARAPSLKRKIIELRYALAMEKKYSKAEILERYLNIAYFGAGAFGVEAAAQRFFSVPAAKLSLRQAATLAGAVRTPYATDPSLDTQRRKRLRERRDIVLDRMAQVGNITQAKADATKKAPLRIRLKPEPGGCAESAYPYFCLYVHKELLNNPVFGNTRAERERRLAKGGAVLRTTLDPVAQRAAQRAISSRVGADDTEVAAEAMIEPGTGRIRAMAASKKYGRNSGNTNNGPRTTYNLPADVAHGGGQGFQAGSTFKVFTLATALSRGWRFDQGYLTPGSFVPGSGFTDCRGHKVNDPDTEIFNAGGEGSGGPYSLSTGTWKSVNIFYMMLEQRVGLCRVVKTAKALGIARADGTPLREVPTFTLGANEMDPVTVAGAFAAFGARGRYCRPMAISDIVERNGRRIQVSPSCNQAIDRGVADAVNHILSGVFTKGTMTGQGIDRDAAGKTGTNNGYTSAWFAGYTPDLAAAVSLGDIRGSYRYPLRDVEIGGEYYGEVQGASLPGPIWVSSMSAALRDVPPSSFHHPDMGRFGGGHTPGLEKDEKEEKAEEASRRPGGRFARERRAVERGTYRRYRDHFRAREHRRHHEWRRWMREWW
ncbi:transglycosylase domain-containing protein [Streptosporangium sp. NBC_01756]|uniref:transglycosylase domain-containing protein n=1 Tax=Streptosporangium sp. NBC_01756 TaxID=2975950 RepID=UPI002DDC47D0|nr:transglycosylase domain-containing protein [Streptosporangium sp. NBC_01756]WSC85096.1 penicillin-binding protein [Streptosporangium sp. NBC_01756]